MLGLRFGESVGFRRKELSKTSEYAEKGWTSDALLHDVVKASRRRTFGALLCDIGYGDEALGGSTSGVVGYNVMTRLAMMRMRTNVHDIRGALQDWYQSLCSDDYKLSSERPKGVIGAEAKDAEFASSGIWLGEEILEIPTRTSLNSVASLLKQCSFRVTGKGQYKDEFVTAGGVPLSEVLNVDGVTGGFNFQAIGIGGQDQPDSILIVGRADNVPTQISVDVNADNICNLVRYVLNPEPSIAVRQPLLSAYNIEEERASQVEVPIFSEAKSEMNLLKGYKMQIIDIREMISEEGARNFQSINEKDKVSYDQGSLLQLCYTVRLSKKNHLSIRMIRDPGGLVTQDRVEGKDESKFSSGSCCNVVVARQAAKQPIVFTLKLDDFCSHRVVAMFLLN
ncbi:hypothetical protein ACLOJK_028505 [Asimina triloba]